ncbi:MAG: multiubiquitin domain-containing protein [Lysobacterales bacterium]|nr:multiubiquitin domain-containing protein [Nitrosomonas nitrosa]MCB1599568.1 multiubiquitin domain-containing protein [Xanthomonadales bacterium]
MNPNIEPTASSAPTRPPPHTVTVVINGRPRQVEKDELTFREVVELAFDNPATGENIVYTVTFKRGQGNKPEGTLVEGETLKPKEGMLINVARTDKS